MNAFDKIIGYGRIKNELIMIGQVLNAKESTDVGNSGALKGLMLYGEPGVGKSLMAEALIEESGRPSYVCRKDRPADSFITEIKNTFKKAVITAPSVILLDDLDKFSNGDEYHLDTPEYVAVQACMDEVRDEDVLVIATVNRPERLPTSLKRPGRFDRIIRIPEPCGEDLKRITEYYLKPLTRTDCIDMKTVTEIMEGSSCAEIKAVISAASMLSKYEGAEEVELKHVVAAYLRTVYDVQDEIPASDCGKEMDNPNTDYAQIVYHEAGHAAVSEILSPGSVKFVCVNSLTGQCRGITCCRGDKSETPQYRNEVSLITKLGGAASVEQTFGVADLGSESDFERVFVELEDLVKYKGVYGLRYHKLGYKDSQYLSEEQERKIAEEADRCYRRAKEILSENRRFLDSLAGALAKEKMLCAEDVRKIRRECGMDA